MKELRESVQWFAGEMEGVLKENDYKKGINPHRLFENMVREVFELNLEMQKANTVYMRCVPSPIAQQVIKEAVDVANYAMLLANKYRNALEETTNERT